MKMEIGKLPTEILEKKILSKIQPNRKEILVGAGVGEDCSVIDFGEEVCVLSTDPITGASKGIGKLAIHISCNDVASNGVEPIAILLTILAPESVSVEEISQVIEEAKETAAQLNVEIIGGHTEVSTAVKKMIVSTTCIGKGKKDFMVTSHGAQVGDDVLMTKWAGLEGSAILAQDREEELKRVLPKDLLEEAKRYINHISVVEEGILAGSLGVTAMHDVTEGGLLGALWELAEASKIGIQIKENLIPVTEATQKICEYFKINPLGLISSGVMLITTNKTEKLLSIFRKRGIQVTKIGKVVQGESGLIKDGKTTPLAPPEADELFKVINL
ncbi:AIR synthase family protein [Garciella nitratireducens]|uniref:Hydrogenase expression/formation protein HypE n=1 Tax=Garciella nitratireducens DSM 15102 TaxID=1121911 RepID=A0A1T4NA70_9FIRM|nr:AIR synthase family protein [Garciella nitratireducens]SJZ76134.1 hydrogenase expression/formation protein HypE [Garciella nitratireducens DSM 15102]